MQKIALTVTAVNGRIIITPPPGVEFVLQEEKADDWWTIAEAAQEFGVSKNTLAKLCDTGGIPYEVRGKNRFVRGQDVKAWAQTPRRRRRGRRARSSSA